MKKTVLTSFVTVMICILLVPTVASAHSWQDGYCDSNYDDYSHTHYYYCDECGEEYSVVEPCDWTFESRDYSNWSGSKHEVTTYYTCPECYGDKTVTQYKKHVNKWVRHGSHFWYECKYCWHTPTFNGDPLVDYNDSDHVSLHKNKKYTYRMFGYHKKLNRVKSIKYSKKKICKVTRKGSKLIIKGKKRGKCKVTVNMKSGAKYVFKVKVR